MFEEPLFNLSNCPLKAGRYNWSNYKFWKWWIFEERWHVIKNMFIVDKHYFIQNDGKRRIKSVLFKKKYANNKASDSKLS